MFNTLKLQKNYFPTDQNTRITKEKKILKNLEICAWWEQKETVMLTLLRIDDALLELIGSEH